MSLGSCVMINRFKIKNKRKFSNYQIMETRTRSFLKTIIYRVAAVITITTLTWIYTGDLYTVTQVAIAYNIIVWSFYYIHERIWARIKWGRIDS
jgi:uncharacterized membrane protein